MVGSDFVGRGRDDLELFIPEVGCEHFINVVVDSQLVVDEGIAVLVARRSGSC